MDKYLKIIQDSFIGYWNYLSQEISQPGWTNYFYWLIGLSLLVWVIELLNPWRKEQKAIRKDFWLDGFYMFFNFFLFSLIGYNALSNVFVELFSDLLANFGIENLIAINVQQWPVWSQFLLMFVVADFIQWNIHRLLHRSPFLWQFHKVHHSVKEMGFAAHLRFHWMETIVYKSIQYLPLAMIGFGIQQFFVIHVVAVFIGHLNHANVGWNYGPFKYIFNNPKMHIWHHAKEIPGNHPYGINFGISLSVWDYVFKTAHVPSNGRDIELGFDGDEGFPKGFLEQAIYPLNKKE
jgi:sterol desaturase/sphingolipid hydroxylase (fatty acid hydroxylase superfamily)